jgi:small-conductance mechanosensitive channel
VTPLANSVIDRAGEALGSGLPRIAAAVVILIVGLLVAWLARRIAIKALRAVHLDDLAERTGIHDALGRAGLPRSLATVLGAALRFGLIVVAVFAAVSLLGLQFLSQSLNAGVLFLPKLLLASALVLAGVVVGGFAHERVNRLGTQMDLPVPLGQAVQFLVIAVFAATALALIGVPMQILTLLLAVVLGSAGLAFALAFGLGSREFARAMGAGRFVRGAFAVGQTIAVGDVAGEIVELESASVLLRSSDGTTVRVPNHILLETPVEIRGEAPEPD